MAWKSVEKEIEEELERFRVVPKQPKWMSIALYCFCCEKTNGGNVESAVSATTGKFKVNRSTVFAARSRWVEYYAYLRSRGDLMSLARCALWELEDIPPKKRERTELYRHFDAEGVLLYVGESLSTTARLIGHRHKSPWFDEITRVEVEHFPTREAAKAAEDRAIAEEHPKYNIKGNNGSERC
jgi:hypothetical protein